MNKEISIFGCGISASTLANVLANKGWKVTIYEKQNFIGGNCYDEYDKSKVLIHKFGPHIFHTSNEEVFNFVSQFTKLNGYVNKVLCNTDGKLFPLPINFKSIEIIMGNEAQATIDLLKNNFPKKTITLFELREIENPLIKKLVDYISRNVYFNYSAKMWGVPFNEISPDTINRVKIVLGYEHDYFPDDKYQGLPIEGYTKMISNMLNHPNISINLGVDGVKLLKFDNKGIYINNVLTSTPIVYCGPLDELANYKYGVLPYRSLKIDFETLPVTDFQQTAVINYPADPKMTRIAEYKKMTLQEQSNVTTISREYPGQFDLQSKEFNVRFYPIVNPTNKTLYEKYVNDFKSYHNFHLLGRLSQYKYFDMDDAIASALELAKKIDYE